MTSPPAKAPETKNDTGNLGEYKRALQDVRLWVDDAAHAAASRGKDHLAEVVKETKKVLDEKMLTMADVEKAMREAFAPLRDKLLPTTLGPLPEAGGAGRTIRDVLLATEEHAAKGHKRLWRTRRGTPTGVSTPWAPRWPTCRPTSATES